MPHAFRIYLELDGDGTPVPAHLRGFASDLFERGTAAGHHAQIKPYTVGRLTPLGGTAWSLDVTTTLDALDPLVAERIVPGRRVFLGPLADAVSAPPVTLVRRTWADMAIPLPIAGVEFSLDTPVVFRRQGGQHPVPTAHLVFGHLRRRWRNLAPDTAPDVAFQNVEFAIDLDGTRVEALTPGSGAYVGRSVEAFAGTVAISIVDATMQERAAFGSLAQAAPFVGIGSSTTAGFGAVSLIALWIDD